MVEQADNVDFGIGRSMVQRDLTARFLAAMPEKKAPQICGA
jgi:hypothetical protein